jgi:flagellar basal-body rod protein FlgG
MHTAATGMIAQTLRVDTIANNLANANTTGFKKTQMDFADLMYVVTAYPGARVTGGNEMPTGLEMGSGVMPVSTLKIFTSGSFTKTDNALDLAIAGDGFFQIQAVNGETRYTRDGNFRIASDGTVVNSEGFPLSPSITVPTDAEHVAVSADGTVVATVGETSTESGTVTLARFVNPAGLSSVGGNLFKETDASGTPTTGTPGEAGYGTIQQGYLEMSNVDVVTELVDLIIAQRTYELNAKVIKAGDRILNVTNSIAG